jgi:hypothetical protein
MPIGPKKNLRNSVVFLDVSIANRPVGRIKIELFLEALGPQAAKHLRESFTGERRENGVPIGLKNTVFSQITTDAVFHAGVPALLSLPTTPAASATQPGSLFVDKSGALCFSLSSAPCKGVLAGEVYDQESLFVLRMIGNIPGVSSLEAKITECGEF